MRNLQTVTVLATAVLASALLAPMLVAEAKPDSEAVAKGAIVYGRFCVACHGTGGLGDGPVAKDLSVPVPDLTTLAARNEGRYPHERVQRIIKSGEPLRGHGTPDMPAWGDAFKKTEGTDARTPEEAIRSLTHYIWSLQRKAER
jgi:mono/diheme cytochrome c family protein